MKTYKCFNQITYDRNLRRVTAVYYYDGKVGTGNRIWFIMDVLMDILITNIDGILLFGINVLKVRCELLTMEVKPFESSVKLNQKNQDTFLLFDCI